MPNEKVAPAQVAALQKWGAPAKDPYAYLKKIPQPTLVVNGSNDVIVYTVNSFILQQTYRMRNSSCTPTGIMVRSINTQNCLLSTSHSSSKAEPRKARPKHERKTGVVVSVAGRVVVDSRNALTLREAAYPPVQYIPPKDVDFAQLERTDHVTYCPYKGDCNYYSVPAGGKKSANAVWSYDDPFLAVEQIRGYVAFYPERVDKIAEQFPNVRKD